MLFNMSILPLIDSFTSALCCCITSVISCLNWCWKIGKSAGATTSAHCAAEAAAAAAATATVLGFGAPLPSQMEVCFVARLTHRHELEE